MSASTLMNIALIIFILELHHHRCHTPHGLGKIRKIQDAPRWEVSRGHVSPRLPANEPRVRHVVRAAVWRARPRHGEEPWPGLQVVGGPVGLVVVRCGCVPRKQRNVRTVSPQRSRHGDRAGPLRIRPHLPALHTSHGALALRAVTDQPESVQHRVCVRMQLEVHHPSAWDLKLPPSRAHFTSHIPLHHSLRTSHCAQRLIEQTFRKSRVLS